MSSVPTAATATAAPAGGQGREGSSVWGTAPQSMAGTLPFAEEEDEDDEQSDEDDLFDFEGKITPEMVTAALAAEKRREKVRTVRRDWA